MKNTPRRFRYPGQPPELWAVLADIRQSSVIDDEMAERIWDAFAGDRSAKATMGELVWRLYEAGFIARRSRAA